MKNILSKLLAIRRAVPKMEKDGTNTMQKYSYLSETQITEKMKELLDKHGVVFGCKSNIVNTLEVSPTSKGTKQFVTTVKVDYQFIDTDSGEMIEGEAVGQGCDTGDKGVYKAITGAVKYIFMKNFLIPTGDDPEKDTTQDTQISNFTI